MQGHMRGRQQAEARENERRAWESGHALSSITVKVVERMERVTPRLSEWIKLR